jgi:serine/threonine protein kinase
MADAPEEHVNLSFAIKFFTHERALEQADSVQRFLDQAEALRRVEGPFLARIHRVLDLRPFREDGWPAAAIVSQLVEPSLQRALSDLAAQQQRLSVGLVLRWARQLFEAVEALHGGFGLVHGNIKPSNILLHLLRGRLYRGKESLEGATVLLADLVTAWPIGKPVPPWAAAEDEWKAPEAARPGARDRLAAPAEDLYALGLVLGRLADATEGDLAPLRGVVAGLTDADSQRRLPAKRELRAFLFPAEEPLDTTDESAVILRRSEALAMTHQGSASVRERREGRAAGWPEIDGIPGYAILREIGRGGMGIVYEARDLRLSRRVAIKVLLQGVDVSRAERFRIEAGALALLNHPNIVQVYGGSAEGERAYLVLERVSGSSLRQIVGSQGPLPPQEAARLGETIAGALHFAHTQGVLHRDIKPANVLITPEGTPKLIDFGLAKLWNDDSGLTPAGTVMGTLHYLAPEVLRGSDRASVRTDLYSLGATLYYALTGQSPLQARTYAELLAEIETGQPVAPRQRNPAIPPALEAICLRCLDKRPENRFATVGELADALRHFRAGDGAPVVTFRTGAAPLLGSPGALAPPGTSQAKETPEVVAAILTRLFRGATEVTVLDLSLDFDPHPGEVLLAVQVTGSNRHACHVIKVTSADRCPSSSDWDEVLMSPEAHLDEQGQMRAVIYRAPPRFDEAERVTTLEVAFYSAVATGSPGPASIADVLTALFACLGRLFYRSAAVEAPAARLLLTEGRPLEDSFAFWESGSALDARQVANTALPLGKDDPGSEDNFCDPVDALRFLVEHDGPAGERFPPLRRGRAHGGVHGRNVLIGLVGGEAHWPALFDCEREAGDALLGWDFVQLETELKIHAYPLLFPGSSLLDYARGVKEFETALGDDTDRLDAEDGWREQTWASPAERLRALLLTIRRLAAVHLGQQHARRDDWLAEHDFLLACYGAYRGRYSDPLPRNRIGAFVSAGVACARYLSRRQQLTPPAQSSAERAGGKSPDFRRPLKQAWAWTREKTGESLPRALLLLEELKARYPHALPIRYELALALVELGRPDDALRELEAAGREHKVLDEDTLSLRGRCWKDAGDRALSQHLESEALRLYGLAEEDYRKAYALRRDRFPGINVATLRFLRAALASRLGQTAQSSDLLQASRQMARALLAGKDRWVRRLSDDNVWMAATEAEAHLLLGDWELAEELYGKARQQDNYRAFHAGTMRAQVARLTEAYRRLEQAPQGPLFDPDAFFAWPK